MFVAVAVTTFVGCSKEMSEIADNGEPKMVEMSIIVDDATTRTIIDENNKVTWAATGEKMQVVEIKDGKPDFKPTKDDYTLSGGKAKFGVSFTASTDVKEYVYAAIYPYSAAVASSDNTAHEAYKVSLPNVQSPSLTSFDAAADLMIAKPVVGTAQATELNFQFGRIVALAKMSISNLAIAASGEYVKSVKFTAPGTTLSGWGKINFKTGNVKADEWGYVSNYKFDNVLAKYAKDAITTSAFDVWFTCIPATVGNSFSVEVTTNRGVYKRDVTGLTAGALKFPIGDLTKFSVNMASATFTEVEQSIFNVSFGEHSTTKVTYEAGLDLGVTGDSADALAFEFSNRTEALRSTNSLSGYAGATGNHAWWSAKTVTLTISNVDLAGETNFALSFGAGAGVATIQAYISKDGTNFFPLSASGITSESTKSGAALLKTMNFNLNAAVSDKVSIKLENISTEGCAIDDVKLVALTAAGSGSYEVDIQTPPSLSTTPDNGGALTFAANNGTAGNAPAAQSIAYTFGGDNCTLSVEKAASDTWYTIVDNGSGTITVTPTEYTATDADRTGTVTVKVMKAGVAILTNTITIQQRNAGSVLAPGTVLWSETWGAASVASVASYTKTGTTIYNSGDISGITYSDTNSSNKIEPVVAGQVTEGANYFFYKGAITSMTVSGIKLYGTSKLTLSFLTNKTNIQVSYSIDGGSSVSLLTKSISSGATTATIDIPSGSAAIALTFTNNSTTSNARLDTISLTVSD